MTLFVVWEWLNDNNNYLPYSEIVSSELEKALVANVKEVNLGEVDPYLEPFKVNVPQMIQLSSYNARNRTVKRTAIDQNHPLARGLKWEWNFHHEHWFAYGAQVSEEIQRASDGGAGAFQLPTIFPGYLFDINSLVQKNVSTGYKRKMRCIPCSPYNQPISSLAPATAPATMPASQPTSTQPIPSYQPIPSHAVSSHAAVSSQFQPPGSYPANSQSGLPRRPHGSQPLPSQQAQSSSQNHSSSQPQNPASTQNLAASQPIPSQTQPPSSQASSAQQPGHLSNTLKSILKSSCTPYKCPPSKLSDICPVCQNSMSDSSDYTTDTSLTGLQHEKITLSCNHHIHTQCLYAMVSAATDKSSFACPHCQQSFGLRTGNQPTNGRMSVKVDNSISLAGFENMGTIIVTYSFSSGVQDGVSYTAQGFPRISYFPDTDQGNQVVDLIKEAFKRRLIFTIGTSSTTGQNSCVVWNDIHHKTSRARGDAHGYPDPGYLDRVTDELKCKGVQ